ncbi:hypothetical protein LIER_17876 [Lithospermum erythrorhizon]|uniref:Reverse transcriptase Ty1/copia-type domain-containing protein n=1 Tax=Lithospermum erythrorhizon TaxID=34254 RepID=A0AAV3QGE3_LITER
MLICGIDLQQVEETKSFLSTNVFMKDMCVADVILGIKITRFSNELTLSQSHYIEKVLKKFKSYDCKGASTPFHHSVSLTKNIGEPVQQLEYSKVMGCLMYAMKCSRPDIGFSVVKLRYSDTSWISNSAHSSTSEWIFSLGQGTVSWGSKNQTCIVDSSMASEFIALA